MLEAFQSHIKEKFPELLESRFLLACSGGIDSMVLVDLCSRCQMDFAVAHCNFQLRGLQSDRDEKLVKQKADDLGKRFLLKRFNTDDYSFRNKVSIQMAARELRYSWFSQIMQKSSISILVTAHHADDNLETFLINLSRGTGIIGLTGIPEKTDSLARPLLNFSRTQIEAYAKTENIEWREDSSNADTKYLRNNIRHRIVPLLQALNPNFSENFRKTQSFLSQTAEIAADHIEKLKAALFQRRGKVIKIPIEQIADLKPLKGYLYGLFNEYGFTEWNDVEHLLHATSGKEIRSKNYRLVKDRDFLLLTEIALRTDLKPKNSNKFSFKEKSPSLKSNTPNSSMHFPPRGKDGWDKTTKFLINENQHLISTPVKLSISKVDNIGETGRHILYVSQKSLKYPLTLRNWQTADYFYPLGMQGKKKLSKFFKDEKVDVLSKEDQWLLCSDEEIVWVVGRRADERFKVKGDTEQILKFELRSPKTD